MSYCSLNIQTTNPHAPSLPFIDTSAVGDESETILKELKKSVVHYSSSASQIWANPYMRFQVLKKEWERETKHLSSTTEISMHPAYQKIIGMGSRVLPFIFFEMEQKTSHWFWALKAITGEDPVLPEQRGRIKLMTKSWLKWGKLQGII